MNVFVYGTLMFPEVTEPVAGIRCLGEPAVLEQFRRYCVQLNRRRGLYPAIIPEDGSQVEGLLLRDVSEKQLERLDEFEDVQSGSYVREWCTVKSETGLHDAWVYVCGQLLRSYLNGPWNPDEFRRLELDWYVRNVVGDVTGG